MQNAGKPKLMPLIGYGERLVKGCKISRGLSAMELAPGQYLVHVTDIVATDPPPPLLGPGDPPHSMTVVLQAASLEELLAMFFEGEDHSSPHAEPPTDPQE